MRSGMKGEARGRLRGERCQRNGDQRWRHDRRRRDADAAVDALTGRKRRRNGRPCVVGGVMTMAAARMSRMIVSRMILIRLTMRVAGKAAVVPEQGRDLRHRHRRRLQKRQHAERHGRRGAQQGGSGPERRP